MQITINWDDLGINEVTNLFLYGTLNMPANLQDEVILNHEPVELILTNVTSFMTDGPARSPYEVQRNTGHRSYEIPYYASSNGLVSTRCLAKVIDCDFIY